VARPTSSSPASDDALPPGSGASGWRALFSKLSRGKPAPPREPALAPGITDPVELSIFLRQTAVAFATGNMTLEKALSQTEQLIARGADVNVRNGAGETPLFLICGRRDAGPLMEALIAAHADVEAGLKDGETPLLRAADMACPETMAVLLDHGASVAARKTVPPRMQIGDASIGGGDRDVFDKVIINSVDEHPAILEARAECLKLLMDRGHQPSRSDLLSVYFNRPHLRHLFPGVEEARQLEKAAEEEDLAAVNALLQRGVKPDAAAAFGADPALQVAIEKKNTAIIDALLDAGADIELCSPQSNLVPLRRALGWADGATVAHLLDRGANPVIPGLTSEEAIRRYTEDEGAIKALVAAIDKAETALIKPVAVSKPLRFKSP
jgi:ankyrin repeat protein